MLHAFYFGGYEYRILDLKDMSFASAEPGCEGSCDLDVPEGIRYTTSKDHTAAMKQFMVSHETPFIAVVIDDNGDPVAIATPGHHIGIRFKIFNAAKIQRPLKYPKQYFLGPCRMAWKRRKLWVLRPRNQDYSVLGRCGIEFTTLYPPSGAILFFTIILRCCNFLIYNSMGKIIFF